MLLSKIFSDNMILQRNKSTLLRGEGSVGEVISATIADKKCSAVVGEDGYFEVKLPEFEAGGPYEMRVSSDNGQDDILITGILFGDVYLLGGQSNMELTIGMLPDKNKDVVTSAENANIRMFQVPKEYDFSGKVRNITSGEWKAVSTDSIADFSAIGYYFAKLKYEDDKVPVGLVHTAIGGTPIEALMSEENLLAQAEKIRKTHDIKGQCDNNKNMGCIFCYEKLLEKVKQPGYIEKTVKEDLKRVADWHKALDDNDEGLSAEWMNSLLDTDETIELPGFFIGTKYEDYIGSLWLQRTVNVPESFIGKEALLSLGTLVDFDTAYVNGIKVGSTDYKYPQRRYVVGKDLLKAGDNLITIRLGMDNNIGGAIPDMPYYLICGDEKLDLTGSWRIKEGAKADRLDGETLFVWNPTAQFNSNIAPLKGYGFDAVLFYQGESNCGRPEYYGELMIAMIDEWRDLFGELPFYVAELAYYLGDGPVYADDPFEGVREVQREIVPKLKDAYLIPVCDLGQYNELHPQNKDEVAARFYEEYKKHR